jgi:hypothetical protein
VELIAVSRLPTKWGLFRAYCYQSKLDGTEHIAVAKVIYIMLFSLLLGLEIGQKMQIMFLFDVSEEQINSSSHRSFQ